MLKCGQITISIVITINGEYLECVQECGEDDDVCKRDSLCHKEGACQQVCVEKLQGCQQVRLRAFYILQNV